MAPSDPDLFDVKRRQPRKKSAPAPDGAVQQLLGIYRAAYERRFHELPVITKKDAALLKALILKFGQEKVESRLKAFFGWEDRFVQECGYTLAMLYREWNRLTAYLQQQQARTKTSVPDVQQTQKYLAAMRAGKKK